MRITLSKSRFHKFLGLAVLSGLSLSSTAYAGFEWVPPKQKQDTMMVQEAPITPVANEELQTPMMMPAPNSGMTTDIQVEPTESNVENSTIKTLNFEKPETKEAETENVMMPAPFDEQKEAKAISVKELEESEKNTDIMASETEEQISMPSENSTAPISLLPEEENSQKAMVEPVKTHEQKKTMIQPFPIMRGHNKDYMNANIAPAIVQPSTNEKEVVMGFGKEMPLALALKKIVPDGMAYSFSSGVNPGTRVTWNGGKSWDVVLSETLKPLGLDMYQKGNTIVVHRSDLQKPDTTSSLDTNNNLDTIVNVEPAAGKDFSADKELNAVTTPQRVNIQDPGEMENISHTSSTTDKQLPMMQKQESRVEPIEKTSWTAKKGDSLKSISYMWGKNSDMQIIWEASHDFVLEENFAFTGSAKDAFEKLMQNNQGIKKDIIARFIENSQNPNKIEMIIVQDKEQFVKKQKDNLQKTG